MINIGKYTFDGPYLSTMNLENKSGIYAIIDARSNGNYVIDIGESSEIRMRLENHDRKHCWIRNCSGSIQVAIMYTPNLQQAGRMQIEQELRDQFTPACGIR